MPLKSLNRGCRLIPCFSSLLSCGRAQPDSLLPRPAVNAAFVPELERRFFERKISRSLRCGSMLLKRLGMFSWPILKVRLYTYIEGNVTIRELIDKQRKRVCSGDPAERLAAALLIPAELSRRLRLLDNSDIAQLLDDEVCKNMSISAPEAAVCVEAAIRLRRATNSRQV
jgi:hypothetical protein